MKGVFKFILISIITIIIGVWIGWYLAKSNLPINLMNYIITPIIENRQININISKTTYPPS